MINLYNNGYVVKAQNKYITFDTNYCGIECFSSWPLDDFFDYTSKALQNEAWEKWFGYQNVLEIVPEKDYLIRYINHCNELRIKTIIFKVETPKNTQIALDELKVIQVLGFDCITGVNLSYLNMNPEAFSMKFNKSFFQLNSNHLFDTLNDAYDFLYRYNELMEAGENLEYGENPTPARLSIVEL